MLHPSRLALAVLTACAFLIPAPAGAQAVETGGVRFEPSAQVGGHELVLNGAGLRYRAIFKVSAIGLYVPRKTDKVEQVLAPSGARRIRLTLLRNVDAAEVGKMLSAGIEANATRAEYVAFLPALVRIGDLAGQIKAMQAGSSILIDWVPETGATLSLGPGYTVGPYKDHAVFTAVAKIWLGASPADASLKEALLGRRGEDKVPY